MISSFEVGSIFRIVDEASPALRKILAQVRELNASITKARENMAALGKGGLGLAGQTGLIKATEETAALATAWGDVAKNAGAARLALGNASRAAIGGGAGGGSANVAAAVRGRRLAHGGGGGAHIGGPSLAIPGGSHVNLRGGAAAALGLTGYGAYEAAQMEDVVWQMIYHSGEANTPENRAKFRKVLQDSMAESGYGLHDTGKAALQEIRMFQGTPGHGVDVLPEMLRAAWIEARAKDSSLEESMKSFIGLSHMTRQYDPEAIKKLAPAFAYLSTSNPNSLSGIERAAGYAVPILQSGLEIDPLQSLLLGTALTRAGATSTKSGTWLREMAVRAMPGTALMSKTALEKHDSALRALGLVDGAGKPTWFSEGKPDVLKMLEIAGSKAESIPLTERASLERQLFGAQGSGGFALLSDKAVLEQVRSLRKEMDSPEFKNRYAAFSQSYREGSTVQNARTAVADFNVTMMDIGANVLPAVNRSLGHFKSILEGVRNALPRTDGKEFATVGGAAITGALGGAVAGGAIGLAGGPVGAVGGAVAGGVLGTAAGFIEQYNDRFKLGFDKAGTYTSPGKTGKPAEKIEIKPQNIQLNLNLDGKTLAQTIAEAFYTFGMQAPAADGLGQYYSGDHNFPSK